ncbi:hypothetical protein [Cobetia marina]|uniref:hypothetical protein n=1 Tax=Cobetia marina TaxID=28258 RepID=UPI003A901EA4
MHTTTEASQATRAAGTDIASDASSASQGAVSGMSIPEQLQEVLSLLMGGGPNFDFGSWWRNSGEFLTQYEIGLKDLMEAAFAAGVISKGNQVAVSAKPISGATEPFEGHFSGVKHFEIGPQLYSHVEDGGLFEVVGQALGEGTCAGSEVMVYRCQVTGSLLYRDTHDFEGQMILSPPCTKETAQ